MVSYELMRGVYFALWYMAAFMVMSFFLGFQIARGTLDAKLPTHSFTMAGSIAELRGVLIRSGERVYCFSTRPARMLISTNGTKLNTFRPSDSACAFTPQSAFSFGKLERGPTSKIANDRRSRGFPNFLPSFQLSKLPIIEA